MAYNTGFTRYKSTQLAGLDCGNTAAVKQAPRTNEWRRFASFTANETIEQGKCVGMIRMFAGERIVGLRLTYANQSAPGGLAQDAVIGVGDPFACGRFLVVNASKPTQVSNPTGALGELCGADIWTMTKMGDEGDGCGIGYLFTCETDIIVTCLYGANSGNQGGWRGGACPSSNPSGGLAYGTTGPSAGATQAIITSGSTIRLVVDIIPA